MSTYRRPQTTGGTYFFTVVSHRRQHIFCDEPLRAALREAIHTVRATLPFTIDGWVLLPDHLHCIWTLPEGDGGFSKRWAMIKRFVSKRCGYLYPDAALTDSQRHRQEAAIWQRRFWEHTIRDEEDYIRHIEYLHYNPVKHGLVAAVRDWPFSTFHRYARQGVYPDDWGGIGKRDRHGSFGEPGDG